MRFLGVGKQRLTRTKRRFRGLDERKINQCSLAFKQPSNTCWSHDYLLLKDTHECTDSGKYHQNPNLETGCSHHDVRCNYSRCLSVFFSELLLQPPVHDSWRVDAHKEGGWNGISPIKFPQKKLRDVKRHHIQFWIHWGFSLFCYMNFLGPRFESGETKQRSESDENLRERLLSKLIEERLLGATRQVAEMDPTTMPLRELPPGNTASVYLMYLAFVRSSGGMAASQINVLHGGKALVSMSQVSAPVGTLQCVLCVSLWERQFALHRIHDGVFGGVWICKCRYVDSILHSI